MTHARALALLALVMALPACGHKGPPVAPLRRTPPMLRQFRLAQRGNALEVSCTAPRASVDGVAFESLDIEIFWGEGWIDLEKEGDSRTVQALPGARVVEALPLPAPGTLVRAASRPAVGSNRGQRTLILALEAQLPLTPPHELTAQLRVEGVALSWQGSMPEPVAPPDLGPAGGTPLPFSDFFSRERPTPETATPEAPTPDSESPATEDEAGATGGADTVSPGSPPVGEATDPVGEATDPVGETADPVGEEGADPEELPRTHGFLVYRRARAGTYGVPLTREPLETQTLVDPNAPLGATVCYVIRAAGSVEPLIESAPSNEVCVAVHDITPPSPPTGLAVVPRDEGLEVVWSPSPAPDLGGYRIYRAAGEGDAEVVAEVAAADTAWHDTLVEAGVLYRYSIAALDRAGNEGPPSGAAEGRPQ